MSWEIAVAMAASAAIQAGSSTIASAQETQAAKGAQNFNARNIRMARRVFEPHFLDALKALRPYEAAGRAGLEPFRKAGVAGGELSARTLQLLEQLVMGSGEIEGLELSPLAKWRLKQQEKNILRQQAALGDADSGVTRELLSKSTEAITAKESEKLYSRLAGLQSTGYGQLTNLVNLGAGASRDLASTYMAGGQTLASIYSGARSVAPNLSGAQLATNIGNIGASGLQGYAQYSMYQEGLNALRDLAPASQAPKTYTQPPRNPYSNAPIGA